jgi:hypothetical protein
MMLYRILKLFGLDVPAKIEAVKAEIEFRVDVINAQAKHAARETAIVAAVSTTAMLLVVMAIVVGLIALYRWTAEYYGDLAGLGIDELILVSAVLVLGGVAMVKSKSLFLPSEDLPQRPRVLATTPETSASTYEWVPETPVASAADLVEPLTFLASVYFKFPTLGNPALDDAIGHLRAATRGSAGEAISRAANVVRYGSGANQAAVLAGMAFFGWLVTQYARQHSSDSPKST